MLFVVVVAAAAANQLVLYGGGFHAAGASDSKNGEHVADTAMVDRTTPRGDGRTAVIKIGSRLRGCQGAPTAPTASGVAGLL